MTIPEYYKPTGPGADGVPVVEVDIAAMAARITQLEAALAWYAEQARLARLIHSEGDAGRAALAADGGTRALNVLGK